MKLYQYKINKLINQYDQRKNFFGSQSNEEINKTEKILEVTLPTSYKWFLSKYGGGGNGFYFSNCEMMLFYKQQYPSIPNGFVMIYWCDEYGYCLDTNKIQDGECPVVNWSPYESKVYISKPNFYEFFLEQIEEALDNDFWDE